MSGSANTPAERVAYYEWKAGDDNAIALPIEVWSAACAWQREQMAAHFTLCDHNQFTGPGVAKIIRTRNWGFM